MSGTHVEKSHNGTSRPEPNKKIKKRSLRILLNTKGNINIAHHKKGLDILIKDVDQNYKKISKLFFAYLKLEANLCDTLIVYLLQDLNFRLSKPDFRLLLSKLSKAKYFDVRNRLFSEKNKYKFEYALYQRLETNNVISAGNNSPRTPKNPKITNKEILQDIRIKCHEVIDSYHDNLELHPQLTKVEINDWQEEFEELILNTLELLPHEKLDDKYIDKLKQIKTNIEDFVKNYQASFDNNLLLGIVKKLCEVEELIAIAENDKKSESSYLYAGLDKKNALAIMYAFRYLGFNKDKNARNMPYANNRADELNENDLKDYLLRELYTTLIQNEHTYTASADYYYVRVRQVSAKRRMEELLQESCKQSLPKTQKDASNEQKQDQHNPSDAKDSNHNSVSDDASEDDIAITIQQDNERSQHEQLKITENKKIKQKAAYLSTYLACIALGLSLGITLTAVGALSFISVWLSGVLAVSATSALVMTGICSSMLLGLGGWLIAYSFDTAGVINCPNKNNSPTNASTIVSSSGRNGIIRQLSLQSTNSNDSEGITGVPTSNFVTVTRTMDSNTFEKNKK